MCESPSGPGAMSDSRPQGATGKDGWLSFLLPNMQRKITKLNYDLIEEARRCSEDSQLSLGLRDELESFSREIRREVVNKTRNGCAPLFIVSRRGCVPIAEYLVTVCEANIEQRGLYEAPEDRTFHHVTPLWCAVVSGKLAMVKYLQRIGCDLDAMSDSGSTPVRSACFMSHYSIVRFLVEHGANITKPNVNGGTCLINSVQSPQLCHYLIDMGADVNAQDIQKKTALHYAIQEHRLETTILLLKHGADPFIQSRYGDDALRTACLKGAHHIFDYLKSHLEYPSARLADAHELIGATFFDEHSERRVAILHWRLAHHIRSVATPYLEKLPAIASRAAYRHAKEFRTLEELDAITDDIDAMRIQSLMICERILGINHKDMLFRLTFRGAAYADALQVQRCIDLWLLLVQVRIDHFTLLHFDTCFATQALVRMMLDLYERHRLATEAAEEGVNETPRQRHMNYTEDLPRFEDAMCVFQMLADALPETETWLRPRPIYRKQQENFDRILKCTVHLVYILSGIARTFEHKREIFRAVRKLVDANICSSMTNDSLLHLSVSGLNIIRNVYLSDDINVHVVFPNATVIKLLLDCRMNVNAKNLAKSTPLHVAVQPYNYNRSIVLLLLDHGADLDVPNKSDERPFDTIMRYADNNIPLLRYSSLKCLAANVICKNRILYANQLPRDLVSFVRQHES